jgi:hypothetical protein
VVVIPRDAGLSAGRNALVRQVRTPFVAIMDDDLELTSNRSLLVLLDALQRSSSDEGTGGRLEAALAGGCYFDAQRQARDCFNMRFDVSEDSHSVHLRSAQLPDGKCSHVHLTHNFFVARTEVVSRLRWDPRQRIMEHETFFYQLYLNGERVLGCPDAVATHNTRTSRDDAYELRSMRATEGLEGRDPGNRFMQYLCKNFPRIRRFRTPFTTWRCDLHQFCTPLWDAEFAHDGRHCSSFQWDPTEDSSAVRYPLLDMPRVDRSTEHARNELPFFSRRRKPAVPLLALILTERPHVEQRAWQRRTWLTFAWHSLSNRNADGEVVKGLGNGLVPWQYVYVMPMPSASNRSQTAHIGDMMGDVVALARSPRSERPFSQRAIQWALSHVTFDAVLLTDDQSIVHIGRIWEWLHTQTQLANLKLLAVRRSVTARVHHIRDVVPSLGSALLGRTACALAFRSGNYAVEPPSENGSTIGVVGMHGFRKVHKRPSDAKDSIFQGALLVDGVYTKDVGASLQAFRSLMTAKSHPAVWQNPVAFSRDDCDGCQSIYFR